MAAHYDNFDYPSYWLGREYEHESEALALKMMLSRIKRVRRVADLGCGYGRLAPYYLHRAKSAVLVDSSKKLLNEAKTIVSKLHTRGKVTFVQARLERAYGLFRNKSFDLIIFIRVLHNVGEPEKHISQLSKLLGSGGYLIIEFPNKIHWKALWRNFSRGNLTFPLEIEATDTRSEKSKRKHFIPLYNFHPDIISNVLQDSGFEVVEMRSVSNIRSSLAKKYIPLPTLIALEGVLQRPLSYLRFGPSIFILARKK